MALCRNSSAAAISGRLAVRHSRGVVGGGGTARRRSERSGRSVPRMTSINGQHETAERPAAGQASGLGPEELARAVRAADPAAIMVLPRILRRVIKQHRDLGGFAYKVPHRKSYVIDRQTLLEIADHWELGLDGHADAAGAGDSDRAAQWPQGRRHDRRGGAYPLLAAVVPRPGASRAGTAGRRGQVQRAGRPPPHAATRADRVRGDPQRLAAGRYAAAAARRPQRLHRVRGHVSRIAALCAELPESLLSRAWKTWRPSTACWPRTWTPRSLFRVTRPPGAPEPSDFASLNSDDGLPAEGDVPDVRAAAARAAVGRRGIAG